MTRYKTAALVTCAREPSLHAHEQVLIDRFAHAGWQARPVLWDDASVDWRGFDRVVLRSTWDYFERLGEFRAWLDGLERAGVAPLNPLPLVRWNLDKLYLRELLDRGVPIVPTRFIGAGERLDLEDEVRARGWREAILKPAVSGGAFRTHRFTPDSAAALQPELERIVAAGGALLQPFAREILDEGEWSLLFFGGRFSHAVLKTVATGEFRIQLQYGGSYHLVTPPPSLLHAAERIVSLLPARPAYARIDGLRRDGELLLMEVEVIEPYLYLPACAEAADRFVRACIDADQLAAA